MPSNNTSGWAENVIIADADHLDRVAFDLTVNFERMLERRIPRADLARWAECVVLDGGLREGDHHTHLILIHDPKKAAFDNFTPAHFENELNGQAFNGPLGEFTISAIQIEENVGGDRLLCDTVAYITAQPEVKRIMIIPDEERDYDTVRQLLRQADPDKHITLFAMQPMPGGNFRQEILGYSLMSALGIKGEEL
ncbi:MAG: hypothetical protein IKX36_04200 [Prevotella sp.]|nr:hypothetical protein [Prevotella sp.]